MFEPVIHKQVMSIQAVEIDNADAKFRKLAFNGIETQMGSHIEAVEKTKAILLKNSRPLAIICSVGVEAVSEAKTEMGGHMISSYDFAKQMTGALQSVLYVVTIGETYQKNLSTRELFFLDCWGTAYVDALACKVEERIHSILAGIGLGISGRYSPGYGDMRLEEQRVIFSLLDAAGIGVDLLDSCIMKPQKSMSGIIAVSSTRGEHAEIGKCDDCSIAKTCAYRT